MVEREAGSRAPEVPDPVRAYVGALWRWRAVLACAVALLVAGAAAGIARLELASSYEVYFDERNPQLEALDALHDTFSRNDNVLFALAPHGGDAFSPEALAAASDLTARAWSLPYAARVDSVTNFQHVSSDPEGVQIRDLVPGPGVLDAAGAARVRALAMAQPALVGRLVAASGDVIAVNVRLALRGDSRAAVLEAAQAARSLAALVEREHGGMQVRVTGNAMLNAAFSEASLDDLRRLTPFMYLVIAIGAAALLRSLRAALLAMAVVALASLLAMGVAGWSGIVLSSASVVAPTIITTVALAYSLHVIASFLRERARGATPREGVERSLAANAAPVAVTALTTAVGFLSLNFSEAPPFRDLGNITTLGVLTAALLTAVVLPVGLIAWAPGGRRAPVLDLGGFSRWVLARRRAALVGVVAVASGCAAAIPTMEVNDAFVEYFDQRIPFRRDTDFVMEHLGGIYQVEYAVRSREAFGVADPDYLRVLDAFCRWLEAQPEVTHVASITDLLRRLNRHLGEGRDALPGERELAAQLLLAYEMSVPYGLDLNDRVDVDRSVTRVTATLRNPDNARLRDFEDRAAQWLEQHAPPFMRAPPVGAAVMFATIAERNIKAMLRGTLLALVLICAFLAAVLRSVRLGLLCLLPNVVPVVVAFGAWAMLVGQMGVALAIVSAMSLGIVVDDTVHFTAAFLRARRRLRLTPEAAVHHAFETTGTALASTSLVLVLGFAVLSLSAFQVNHGMGQLTALVILCALAADFLMLPGLLIAAARRGWT